jgi:hypothetical protein
MEPTNKQFPMSHVSIVPKEKVDTSKMETVSKNHDSEVDEHEDPYDHESVNLAPRNLGTPYQTSTWAQRVEGPEGYSDRSDDTYRAKAHIHPFSKSGPKAVTGTGSGKTIEEARNAAFNNASDNRIKSTQNVSKQIAQNDKYGRKIKEQNATRGKQIPVIKIDSSK